MKFDRFLELGAILEPGKPPKTDKAAILIDAVRMVSQLRGEAQMLKDSNTSLSEKIKELKVSVLQLSDQEEFPSRYGTPLERFLHTTTLVM